MISKTRLARLEHMQGVIALPATAPLQTPADVLELLDQTIRDVRTGRLDVRAAAVIGGLASVALKSMELGDLADQLDALSAILAPDKRRRLPGRRR